jgi:hypothetical protein
MGAAGSSFQPSSTPRLVWALTRHYILALYDYVLMQKMKGKA